MFEKLIFVVYLKILLMNNDVFSAQMHTECHRHFTVYRYAARTACIHVSAYISLIPRPRSTFGWGLEMRLYIWRINNMHEQICMHDILHMSPRKITFVATRPKIGRVQKSFVVR